MQHVLAMFASNVTPSIARRRRGRSRCLRRCRHGVPDPDGALFAGVATLFQTIDAGRNIPLLKWCTVERLIAGHQLCLRSDHDRHRQVVRHGGADGIGGCRRTVPCGAWHHHRTHPALVPEFRLVSRMVITTIGLYLIPVPRHQICVTDGKTFSTQMNIASRDEIAALQLQRLQWTLSHAENVPLYRRKFDEAGVRPEDMKAPEDMQNSSPQKGPSAGYPFEIGAWMSRASTSSGTTASRPCSATFRRTSTTGRIWWRLDPRFRRPAKYVASASSPAV